MNQHLYKPDSDIAELAAAHAFGLAKNHPFIDGNKRTAFLALGLFVALVDSILTCNDPPGESRTVGDELARLNDSSYRGDPAQSVWLN